MPLSVQKEFPRAGMLMESQEVIQVLVLVLDIHKVHFITLPKVDQALKKLINKSECQTANTVWDTPLETSFL